MARSADVYLRVEGVQPVQVLAGVAALAFVILSGVGFIRTGNSGDYTRVLGLTLNPLRLLGYFVIGALGLVEATVSATARAYGWLLFLTGGLTFAWGLMVNGIAGNPVAWLGNPLALRLPDGWLHLVAAVFGLLTAVLPARKVIHQREAARRQPRERSMIETTVPSWPRWEPRA